MIDLYLLFFFFLLSSVLLLVGVWRGQYAFVIFSGLLFVLMGLFIFNGIHYPTGNNFVDYGNGSTTMTTVYSVYGGNFNTGAGFILCFFGAGLIATSAFMIYNQRRKTLEMTEEEEL